MTMNMNTVSTVPISGGRYTIDPNDSSVSFQIRHLGISNIRGMFKRFAATLDVGDTLADVHVTAQVDLSSVDTNQPDRDSHLQSTDFFDADSHPQMNFQSTEVRHLGDENYEVGGDLTINGVTKGFTLAVDFSGAELNPFDQRTHIGFSASGELRRSDYGIDFNLPLGVGKVAIADKVQIEIDAQFIAP